MKREHKTVNFLTFIFSTKVQKLTTTGESIEEENGKIHLQGENCMGKHLKMRCLLFVRWKIEIEGKCKINFIK